MSSRQRMAQVGSGRPIGGALGDGGLMGLLSSVTGQNKISGGPTTDASGQLQPGVFSGSSGIFGGASRNQAGQWNAILNAILAQQKGTAALSGQESVQRQNEAKLGNELAEHLMNSKQFSDMATSRGLTVEEMKATAGSIGKEVAGNLIQQQQNIGAGLKSPDVQAATKNQLIAEAGAQDAKNRNLTKLDTGMGGAAVMPGPNNGPPTSITGAVPGGQQTSLMGTGPIDPKTGQPMMQTPVTNVQPYTQPKINMPIPANILNGANSLTPGGTNATPGLATGMPQDNMLSTDSPPQVNNQGVLPANLMSMLSMGKQQPAQGGGKPGGGQSQGMQNADMNPARAASRLSTGMPDGSQMTGPQPIGGQQSTNPLIQYLLQALSNFSSTSGASAMTQ